MTELLNERTQLTEWTEGPHPFWLAECSRCKKHSLVEYGDLHQHTRAGAHTLAKEWCTEHPVGCGEPAGRPVPETKAGLWLEQAAEDARGGQFDGDDR